MECKSISGGTQDTLQNVLTEAELLKLFGFTKAQLAECRNGKKLPFLKVGRNCRLYLERDVVEWLKGLRTVLNSQL